MIQITDRASTHIRRMLAKRNHGETALRLGVKAGGCSGFEYTFAWEVASKSGDSIFQGSEGALVIVDPKSLRLLDGIVLDYDTSLVSRGFLIDNPQAKSTCGCGTSFSVEDPTARLTAAGQKK
jgi:iron-sulfur cluster assembly accessory protein